MGSSIDLLLIYSCGLQSILPSFNLNPRTAEKFSVSASMTPTMLMLILTKTPAPDADETEMQRPIQCLLPFGLLRLVSSYFLPGRPR